MIYSATCTCVIHLTLKSLYITHIHMLHTTITPIYNIISLLLKTDECVLKLFHLFKIHNEEIKNFKLKIIIISSSKIFNF